MRSAARRRDRGIPVLVLGTGITALGVQRALARAGIPCFMVDRGDPLLLRSRRYRALPGSDEPGGPAGLDAWLRRLPLDRAVLLPCSDAWSAAVAERAVELRQRFPASVPEPASLERLIDKSRFAETLKELEIPRPRMWRLDDAGALDLVPDEALASAFLKPTDSGRFQAAFGAKAFEVESRAGARARLGQARAEGLEMILQEYVPGPPSAHRFVDGFRDREGRIRARFARQRLRMYPPRFGNSTFMRSIPLDEVTDAVAALDRLLEVVDHRGPFSAEFKRDRRDGVDRLLEVNGRPWWYVGFAARCGVDVARMAWLDAQDRDLPSVGSYAIGRTCVFPYYDYFACREARRRAELSLGAWVGSWLRASQPVFDWSDPWPAAAGAADVIAARVRGSAQGRPESGSGERLAAAGDR